jgi:hypothetical protein
VLDTVCPLRDEARSAAADDAEGEPTGVFFDAQTPAALARAIERFEANEAAFDPVSIRRNAERFGGERFVSALLEEMNDLVAKHGRRGTVVQAGVDG